MVLLDLLEQSVDTLFACLPRQKPSKLMAEKVCLIAHRGAHSKQLGIIENTDAAFARALELGCWGIELDVHATADEVLVVNHDPDLLRIWGEDMQIKDLNFADLRQLVPDIPSLTEVISSYGKRMHLFIELKAPFFSQQALHDGLQSLRPCEDYHLLSLDDDLCASLDLFPSEAKLLVASHNNTTAYCQISLERSYGGVLGHYLLLNQQKIKRLKANNQLAGVGHINSKKSLYRELNRGISWIFSNDVALIRHCLDAL